MISHPLDIEIINICKHFISAMEMNLNFTVLLIENILRLHSILIQMNITKLLIILSMSFQNHAENLRADNSIKSFIRRNMKSILASITEIILNYMVLRMASTRKVENFINLSQKTLLPALFTFFSFITAFIVKSSINYFHFRISFIPILIMIQINIAIRQLRKSGIPNVIKPNTVMMNFPKQVYLLAVSLSKQKIGIILVQ